MYICINAMKFCRQSSVVALMISLFATVVVINIYFVYTIVQDIHISQKESYMQSTVDSDKTEKKFHVKHERNQEKYVLSEQNQPVATIKASQKIRQIATELTTKYKTFSTRHNIILKNIISELKDTKKHSWKLWKMAESWVTEKHVLPREAPLLGSVLNFLCSAKIIKADNVKKGTQLKLLFTLEGGQYALFKPQWYSRNEIINGPVYAGRDRHNAEVAAFYLSLLLDLRKVPLSVGRKVNLKKEVMPVASPELLKTFFNKGNNTCFYGVCYYCEPDSAVCENHEVLEGALILWLPTKFQFKRYPSPWQRSYKNNLFARWEKEENYCEKIKSMKQYNPKLTTRLLDLIDAVIFDFLIDNGDRHHYEVILGLNESTVFLFDNGKSFGNPFMDHLDILAPLYQCCLIRRKTWERLKMFSGGALSYSLKKILQYSNIFPVLDNSHLAALDRRLFLIFAAVEICIQENNVPTVLFD